MRVYLITIFAKTFAPIVFWITSNITRNFVINRENCEFYCECRKCPLDVLNGSSSVTFHLKIGVLWYAYQTIIQTNKNPNVLWHMAKYELADDFSFSSILLLLFLSGCTDNSECFRSVFLQSAVCAHVTLIMVSIKTAIRIFFK